VTKIILTRHGHVEGIDPERFRGRAALPLTERGRAQAKAVAAEIARRWRPARVYASPLDRCRTTAEEIARACAVASEPLAGLNDIDYGRWQGLALDDVRAASPEEFTAWFARPHLFRFPEGDSLQDLVARTADALRHVLKHHPAGGEAVVLVGHTSVNRALLLQLLDQPLSAYWRVHQSPCAINEIDVVDGEVRVRSLNETRHLESIG
jgi:probable phosphoglycerate mutase